MIGQDDTTRRQFLALAGGAAIASAVPVLTVRPADATPATLAAAIRNVVGESPVHIGKVKLDIPPLVENGNTVPMTVSVASPMTAGDHVRSIHVFNEKNPQPNIGNFISARAPAARRCRPASDSPIARRSRPSRTLSDGSFWSVSVDIIVTLAACTEEVI